MKFVSRKQWGAQYAQGAGAIPGPVKGVTCHWEGPQMGNFPHSACARKVRSIERFHAVSRGWSGIAYNALVCPHGHVYEGRGVGVRSAANGTSDIGGNDQWYAVCYLSGQGDAFTDEAKVGMAEAIAWLRAHGGAGKAVNGHRDHHPTLCPGDRIYAWTKTVNIKRASKQTVEEDVPLSKQEINDIAKAVWSFEPGAQDKNAGVVLLQARGNASRADNRDVLVRLRRLVRTAIRASQANATPAQVRAALNDLDAEITLVVNEADTKADEQA